MPLGVHEQAPPVAPVISEVGTEEGIANTHCCSHTPGNAHILPLPLPNALGAAYTFLNLAATSHSSAATSHSAATRRSLCNLPMGPCHCQGPSNQALATSPAHCLHLPGSMHSTLSRGYKPPHTEERDSKCPNPLPRKEAALSPKINSKHPSQNTQECSRI